MSNREKRDAVRKLRQQGRQLTEIATELNIPYNTVRKWCRDIELTDTQLDTLSEANPRRAAQQKGAQKNKQNALEDRLAYQEMGREQAQAGNLRHLMGCMLYWGEGAKHRGHLRFTNTDPDMLKLFVEFLRLEFGVPDEKFTLRVLTHSENQEEWVQIQAYWLEFLALPKNTKVAMQLKIGTQSRKKRYQYGICTVDVYSTEIVQNIFGAIQEYIGLDNPKWVE
jgi:transposase-like protein